MAYFLDEIKYEINGCEIDKTGFVGMTTLPNNYLSSEPTAAACLTEQRREMRTQMG